MSHWHFALLNVLVLYLVPRCTAGRGPTSLAEVPAYKSLRSCAQPYVYNGCCTADVYEAVGCPIPAIDACLCREDLRSIGSSFLTKYVNAACSTNAVDLSAAVGIWDTYCSRNGGTPNNVVTTTTKADSISTTGATLLATPAPTLSAATVTQTVTFSNTAVRSISTTSTLATTVTAATTVTKILVGTTAASGTILAPGMTLLVLMLFSMAMGALVLL